MKRVALISAAVLGGFWLAVYGLLSAVSAVMSALVRIAAAALVLGGLCWIAFLGWNAARYVLRW